MTNAFLTLTLRSRKHQLHEELARLHSSVSTFYLSVPNFLQYKKEIIGTMEQAVRYAQLAKNNSEYLSCLHDIAQVDFPCMGDGTRASLVDNASLR